MRKAYRVEGIPANEVHTSKLCGGRVQDGDVHQLDVEDVERRDEDGKLLYRIPWLVPVEGEPGDAWGGALAAREAEIADRHGLTPQTVAEMSVGNLEELDGIGAATARKLLAAAGSLTDTEEADASDEED